MTIPYMENYFEQIKRKPDDNGISLVDHVNKYGDLGVTYEMIVTTIKPNRQLIDYINKNSNSIWEIHCGVFDENGIRNIAEDLL